jgi:hypothetical protein
MPTLEEIVGSTDQDLKRAMHYLFKQPTGSRSKSASKPVKSCSSRWTLGTAQSERLSFRPIQSRRSLLSRSPSRRLNASRPKQTKARRQLLLEKTGTSATKRGTQKMHIKYFKYHGGPLTLSKKSVPSRYRNKKTGCGCALMGSKQDQ